ncbi:MAG TPA: hypothetical protein VFW94_01845 [Candidatus Acidoferrales bacterium]|nr:hypothetical protein [Candidatus Acidoferrales bacterium]
MSRRIKASQVVSPAPPALSAVVRPLEVSIPKLSFNVHEAAAATGKKVGTIKAAIGSGALRAKDGGYPYVILLSDLQTWLSGLPDAEPSPYYIDRAAKRRAA